MAIIIGGGGNETINGDTGPDLNDVIYGGNGNNNGDDTINGLSGNDTIYGGDEDDDLFGGVGNDRIFGGQDTDFVDGGIGNDTIFGGSDQGGDDTLYGGADFDYLDYSDVGAVTVNLSTFVASGAGGSDRIGSIEGVIGGTGADFITGDTLANHLIGNAGSDSLYGGGGNDTLDGGNDADSINGGAGDDSLIGGAGLDILSYSDAAGNVTVNLATGLASGAAGADTVSGFETVQGGAGNDSITGDTVANNLSGGVGNDTLSGGAGIDSLFGGDNDDLLNGGADADVISGGSGTDTASYAGSTGGVNVTINASGNTGGDAAGDTLTGIENLTGSSNADTLTGDAGRNVIDGGDGADAISAGAGSDTVLGGAGADTIAGGTGSDSIDGGSEDDVIAGDLGNDTITGGSGDDLLVGGPSVSGSVAQPLEFNWSEFNNQATIDGGAGVDLTQDTGGIQVNVSLNTGAFGQENRTENDDQIYVAPGETFDSLSSAYIRRVGPAGDPVVMDIQFAPVTGSGFDANVENVEFRISDIDEDTWQDRVVIRAYDALGNEIPVTFVNASADLQTSDGLGGTVNSTTTAGNTDEANADGSVLVQIAGPVARIEISYDNLGTGQQHIHISDIHFDAISTVDNDSVVGGEGDDTVLGGIGFDTLLGGVDNDLLYGGADNDTLYGEAGNDTLLGDAGTDTLYGGVGNDTFLIQEGEVDAAGNDVIYGGGGTEGGAGLGESTVTDFDVIDLTAIGTDRVDVVYDPASTPLNLIGTIFIYQPGLPHIPANLIGTIQFSEIEQVIECFTPGTMILTDRGDVAVEMLQPGDMVMTRDNGLQPLRWTGGRTLSVTELQANPDLQPVRIAKGALGQGPSRTMLVSPQHRVLIEGARAELLFGEAEVLVPAKHLVGQIDATRALPAEGVTYIHILFDSHEIVQSDGIWTESFQPAERTLSAMDAEVRAEILALFPALAADADGFVGARLSLKAHEAKVLLAK